MTKTFGTRTNLNLKMCFTTSMKIEHFIKFFMCLHMTCLVRILKKVSMEPRKNFPKKKINIGYLLVKTLLEELRKFNNDFK